MRAAVAVALLALVGCTANVTTQAESAGDWLRIERKAIYNGMSSVTVMCDTITGTRIYTLDGHGIGVVVGGCH